MRNKVGHIGLLPGIFLILALVSSCATVQEPAPPNFDPLLYPAEKFYVGAGISKDKDKIQAKQNATILAKTDVASKIATTVTSKKEASISDNGINQSSTYKELIEESLLQKLENISFIEEDFSPKNGQVTYAIINKAAWEAQKASSILNEKVQANAILSERYPDMSLAREITILNAALDSLQQTQWGSLVQEKFDGSYGPLMTMVRARRDLLVSRIRLSNLYHIRDGTSSTNLIGAKEAALQQFQDFLVEKLYLEYEKYRVMVASTMSTQELKTVIANHVHFSLAQHHNLLEYFEAPDSTDKLRHVVLAVSKTAWEEQEQSKLDSLYQQVYPIFHSYKSETSVSEQIDVLNKIQNLLATSFLGLAIENRLFPQLNSNKQSITLQRDQLIQSVELSLVSSSSVEEGEIFSVEINLRNTRSLYTDIPITISITDDRKDLVFSQRIFMHDGESYTVRPLIPPEKKIQSLQVTCFWTEYPQQRAETSISIKKVPILKRAWRWLNK